MKIIDLENRKDYDLHLSKITGEETSICPKCSHARKSANQKIKCLGWNHEKEAGYCHHCKTSFAIFKQFTPKKEYKRPEWKNNTELSDGAVQWFEKRGITQFTLRHMKVTEGKEFMPQAGKEMNTIQFNYFRDDSLVNVKYRTGNKQFKLFKDGELIFYNLDAIKETESVIITEGEIDTLTFWEAGIRNCVSVPNGASSGQNNMQYLDNCIDYFEKKTEIILATDNDLPGINLRNELASRLGIERCFKVSFKDCKDANEYLVKYGKEALLQVIAEKEPFPVEGVFTTIDLFDDLELLYRNGLQKGLQINDPIDNLVSFEKGRLYIITGIPGCGKSEYLDYWLVRLNLIHNLKFGYFSPENYPLQLHQSKIISKIVGSEFSQHKMSYSSFIDAVNYMSDNFFWVMPEDDYSVDSVLEKARYLVFRKGISAFVIDPYNKLEHNYGRGESETNYISKFLDKLVTFCHKNNVSIFLVAHPRKMNKDKTTGKMEIPNLYDINGSANFYNKTDFGITVYRDFVENKTQVYVQKVKFKHLGEVGYTEYVYNYHSGRYVELGKSIENWDNSSWITNSEQPVQEMQPNNNFDNEAPF
jgi:twinkle protein